MSAHTPGPWAYRRDLSNIGSTIATVAVCGEYVIGPDCCKSEDVNYESHGEDEADARLIAAAPDLAAEGNALRQFMRILVHGLGIDDETCVNIAYDGKPLTSVSIRDVFARWDAAIAKAEGKA